MTAWWPRCMPSNTPIARKSGPGKRESSGIERRISIRKTQHPFENFFERSIFNFVDCYRIRHIEPAGFRPAQRFQMRAAAEGLSNVMYVRADIKPLAAQHAEVDFRQGDPVNAVAIDVHQPRLALDRFPLARELVKRNAAMLFRRDHRWQLIKIAAELFKYGANLIIIQRGDRPLLNHFALSILRVGGHAKH